MTTKGKVAWAIPIVLILAWAGLVARDILVQPECGWRKPLTSDEDATRLARRAVLSNSDFQRLTNFKSQEEYEKAVSEAFWGADKKIEIGVTGAFVSWVFGTRVSNEGHEYVLYEYINRCGETFDTAIGKF